MASSPILFFSVSLAPPPSPPLRRVKPSSIAALPRLRRHSSFTAVARATPETPFPSFRESRIHHPASLLLPRIAASAVFFFFFVSFSAHASTSLLPSETHPVSSSDSMDGTAEEDEEFRKAFESWKAKTYALTVPLRVVALRGSIPPSWIKDFTQAQGRRSRLGVEFRGSLEAIFSDLSTASKKGSLGPKSAMSADLVSLGDSWLNYAIKESLIDPINAEDQDWFNSLSNKWKVYLCRNNKGQVDSSGYVWAAPYRWGSMVIAYKKNKFRKHNLAPIEDWGDLWRPELAGKISMVDSPREVVGAVLKRMGASYNTKDIESEISGGKNAALRELTMLQRQVRIFDSTHYLKSFAAGDVWVAVGWSGDIIPAAKRMSNVAVVVPKSGASLWADLWAVPSATRFSTDKVGGRVRGPSPLIHQWIEFCLQAARGSPFQKEVIPGASPSALEQPPLEEFQDGMAGKPKLDSNLIAGVPPPDILSRCEFLEPLSVKAMEDYEWLMSRMEKPDNRWFGGRLKQILSAMPLSWRRSSEVNRSEVIQDERSEYKST